MKKSLALAAALALCAPLGAAAAGDDDPLVLIERTVDTRYGSGSAAPDQFQALVDSPLERLVAVEPGDSLQRLTSRLYGIGPSVEHYSTLEQKIVERNKLSDPNRVYAGRQLLLPDLPPLQHKQPDPANPYYGHPRISLGPRLKDVERGAAFDFSKFASTTAAVILDTNRKAAPLMIQWRWVPASVARREIESSGNRVKVVALSGAMQIRYTGSEGAGSGDVSADTAFLSGLLARNGPRHESVVFVLDDSWPSQEEFTRTRDFLRYAVPLVRSRFTLGKAGWNQAVLAPAARTDFPFLQDGRSSHAAQIASSLSPFTALTPAVKVIYLPLSLEQKWAKEIWQEILLVSQTARAKGPALETPYEPIPDALEAAQATTEDLLSRMPGTMSNTVSFADQVSVTALARFAHLYARASRTPFFLNMSWYVATNTMDFGPDADQLGVSLAAAGNETDHDVIADKRLLAYRAKAMPGDVIAVMNPNRDGSITCSSVWKVPSGETFYGLAYDGGIPHACGTSFSTPRVAWLLALREAYNNPVQDPDVPYWFSHYRQFVQNLQDPAAAGYLRYWLSPPRLFSGL